jgi:hypothetical protein
MVVESGIRRRFMASDGEEKIQNQRRDSPFER